MVIIVDFPFGKKKGKVLQKKNRQKNRKYSETNINCEE